MATAPGPAFLVSAEQIGQTLRAARERAGLTQLELTRRARVGIRFLSEMENGKQTARLDKLLAVLRALGLAVTVLPAPRR